MKENPWLAPAAGAAWVGISFATSGVRWGMVTLCVLAVIAGVAIYHSRALRKSPFGFRIGSIRAGKAATQSAAADGGPLPWAPTAGAEPAHPLYLVRELIHPAPADPGVGPGRP